MDKSINVSNRTLFIGDNLEVLRGINSDSIDLIYLDPPFNTGRVHRAGSRTEASGVECSDVWTDVHLKPERLAELEISHPAVFGVITNSRIGHSNGMASYLAYMAVRLAEMARVLKPTGSIYLHCDPHASHYLKVTMDALFGQRHFNNEIVWKRTGAQGGARRWGAIHDLILFYTGRRRNTWNRVWQDHPEEYWSKYYRHEDERGRYQLASLTNEGFRPDDTSMAWRGVNPGEAGRHWAVPLKQLSAAYPDRTDLRELSTQDKLDLLEYAGLVHWPTRGKIPRHKRYSDGVEGAPLQDVVTSIGPIGPWARERTGWPSQKPTKLLDVIVRASSNPGDIVLDPFCGSGTTCVVAEHLDRRWFGIEMLPQARDILRNRLKRELVDIGLRRSQRPQPLVETRPPVRTDIGLGENPGQTALALKRELYGIQGRKCVGCEAEIPIHCLVFSEVDPPENAGRNTKPRQQLLCYGCGLIKGTGSMEYLKLQLYMKGILRPQ